MKTLYRSKNNQVIAGICAGIGEYFSLDANLIRLITLILFVFTGFIPVTLTYIVAWFLIPLGENGE